MSDYNYYEYEPSDSGYNNFNGYGDEPPKKEKKKSGFGKKLLKAVALGLAFGLVAGAAFQASYYFTGNALGVNDSKKEVTADGEKKSGATLSKSDGSIDSTAVSTATTVTDVSDIVENFMPAIVQVTCVSVNEYRDIFLRSYKYESTSAGSGIIVSEDDAFIYIATNNHVISGAESLTITFCDGEAVEAEIQGTVPDYDLAVVRVRISNVKNDTIDAIKIATIGDSDSLQVGDSAIVIGNALGYGQSVTTGVISALNREVTLQSEDGETITNSLIQTDAAVNPGNSGGALLNMNGEVVGVVSAKYSDTSVEGMGYAIPMETASGIIDDLINGTNNFEELNPSTSGKPTLGIKGVDVASSKGQRPNYMPSSGVYVMGVEPGSAAEAAGIVKYDVITGFNGNNINGMTDIQEALQSLNPGETVVVSVCTYSSGYKSTENLFLTLGGE